MRSSYTSGAAPELRRVPGTRPRVVYCVVSHANPPQILRLVRTIRASSPESFILVHHDYNNAYLDRATRRPRVRAT
jgi:hypothetical protein